MEVSELMEHGFNRSNGFQRIKQISFIIKSLSVLISSISLICVLPGKVYAQSKNTTLSDSLLYTYELEEIVLYGSRNFNSPSFLTELNSEEIEKRNAITAAELLKSDPGLTVASGPKAETELKVRGFSANQVLVLVDGHPINPGYYGKVDLSMLPVDNIAKINVVKGPSSVAYGVNNMGGVIDIITKNGFEEPRTVLDVSAGDYKFRKVSFNHSRQINKFNYWISGYENYSKGFILSSKFIPTEFEDGGLRNNSFFQKAGGNIKLGYQTVSNNLYSLSLAYNWAKKDVPTTIYTWDSPKYRKFPEWKRYSAALSGQWNISSSIQLKSVVYLDEYRDRLIDYKTIEMLSDRINYDSRLESRTIGGSLESKFSLFDFHQIHSGLSFKRDIANKKSNIDQPWVKDYTNTGYLFIQDYFRLWENINITAGISCLFFSIEDGLTKNKFSPMVSLSYNFLSNARSFISYSNSIRVPTLFQLYSESSGNTNLKPEEANKIEAGVEWFHFINTNNRYISFQLSYFYNDLKNLIYRASSSRIYENISKAKLNGTEARSVFTYNSYLSTEISYCYLNSPGSSGEIMEGVPKNKARFELNIKTDFGTNLSYELSYFDNRTTYRASKILGSYMLHNLNINHQLADFLKLRVELNNITDAYYEDVLGYPSAGRTFIAGLNLTF
jgi:iron complex outermembrane receptor protein